MSTELLRNKKLLLCILLEAVILPVIGIILLPSCFSEPKTQYLMLMCISIPLFFSFAVLRYSSISKKTLQEITKRMLLFLLIFAVLLIASGLLSGLAAMAVYEAFKSRVDTVSILSYVSYVSAVISCLLYPFIAGFFASLASEEKRYINAGFRLALKRYPILLALIGATFGIGYLAASADSTVLRTVICAAAGALCLFLSLAVITGGYRGEALPGRAGAS